ncbi:MAG TPA: chemotaxis protein CheB [Bryobacteraceae bacterium]|nr:chemotaxis protein CheB [Bryobacteraceae bacterium]
MRRTPPSNSKKKRHDVSSANAVRPTTYETAEREAASFPIVGIGASAGGFEALMQMLQDLPPDTGMAFVFVQHMDPEHKSMLPKLLSKATQMPVVEAQQGMVVQPNHVYVIPPKSDLGVINGVLQILSRRKTGGRYLPVDYFLCSLAEDQGGRAIGVILSGTASDGTVGLNAIKAEGGITFAQDDESSKYYGMPGSAIASGCVDFVLPPNRIGKELARLARHPYIGLPHPAKMPELLPAGEDDFRRILHLLRTACGVDFSDYKPGTIRRRIARRMALQKTESMKEYVDYLCANRAELDALFQDILIHVTSFFREPEAFKILQTRTFPRIMSSKKQGEGIRIWVPGCSTGEEVYSLAIALLEFLGDRASSTPVQIYGTEISEQAIEKARSGTYSEASTRDVSPLRLRRFFTKVDHGYRVNQTIREMCVFARQDLTKDPPFSRMDLISCRNVLIYLGAALQKRIVASFHYGLLDTGFLLLGKSESLAANADLFTLAEKKGRVFAKKANGGMVAPDVLSIREKTNTGAGPISEKPPAYDVLKEADRLVWQRYSHAGLVLNDDLEILHFRGETSNYLSPTSGKASLHVLRMIREELKMELRSVIHRARRQNVPVRGTSVRMRRNGGTQEVSLEVVPLVRPLDKERHFLVLFDRPGKTAAPPETKEPAGTRRGADDVREIGHLRRELDASREYLQSIIEQQEASNEELTSANEEILSSNEELQSSNEELETAKEELQSSNEELVTVNETLQVRNAELAQLSDDLNNVLSGTNIPILIVGEDRRIRRFTPAAERLLNLLPSDVGRPLGNIRPNIDSEDLDALITEVSRTLADLQREVRDKEGRWYSMRIRPYKTSENRIDGVLVALFDIDDLKRSDDALQETKATVSALLGTLVRGILAVDANGRIALVNPGAGQMFGYRPEDMLGQPVEMLLPEQSHAAHAEHRARYFDAPTIRAMKPDRQPVGRRKDGTEFPVEVSLSYLQTAKKWLAVAFVADITELKRAEAALAEKNAALLLSDQGLRTLTATLLTAQEEERERLGRELHDDLSQHLAALAMEAGAMVPQIPGSVAELRHKVQVLYGSLGRLSEDVRRIAHELHPSILEHFGLAVALRSYCEEFSKRNDIKIRFRRRDVPESIPGDAALCLYRVAQECCRNIAKHSGARTASVVLAGAAGGIHLAVRDRGVGFDPDQATKGLGLIGVKERVRLAGGSLSVWSRPGQGVGIEVRIPLEQRAT